MSTSDFSFPHDFQALLDAVLPAFPPLSKEQQRSVDNAGAMFDQNQDELTNNLASTTQRIPLLATDPTNPSNGDFWINTTSNQFKVRMAGATRVVTVV